MDIESLLFSSKLLLFGEQTVLTGSQVLSVPFQKFTGKWEYDEDQNAEMVELLKMLPKDLINLELLEEAVQKGLFFKSNIPRQAGLGSSGALSAALYRFFSHDVKNTIGEIQQDLALIESIFHGRSSGTDALVSFANRAVHTKNGKSSLIDLQLENQQIYISLIDSQKERSAKTYIQLYLDSVENERIDYQLLSEKADQALTLFLQKSDERFHAIRELSIVQLKEFSAFIPDNIKRFWKEGIDQQSYYCKLCGAGGGGYFLCFSKAPIELNETIIPVNY